MMQRIFTFLFFFMALTFCVAQAIPTEENVKEQTAAIPDDIKVLDGTNFLGIDVSPLVEYLVDTLKISGTGLQDLIEVTMELCAALLNALKLIT